MYVVPDFSVIQRFHCKLSISVSVFLTSGVQNHQSGASGKTDVVNIIIPIAKSCLPKAV